jgi:hypothetical protein
MGTSFLVLPADAKKEDRYGAQPRSFENGERYAQPHRICSRPRPTSSPLLQNPIFGTDNRGEVKETARLSLTARPIAFPSRDYRHSGS